MSDHRFHNPFLHTLDLYSYLPILSIYKNPLLPFPTDKAAQKIISLTEIRNWKKKTYDAADTNKKHVPAQLVRHHHHLRHPPRKKSVTEKTYDREALVTSIHNHTRKSMMSRRTDKRKYKREDSVTFPPAAPK